MFTWQAPSSLGEARETNLRKSPLNHLPDTNVRARVWSGHTKGIGAVHAAKRRAFHLALLAKGSATVTGWQDSQSAKKILHRSAHRSASGATIPTPMSPPASIPQSAAAVAAGPGSPRPRVADDILDIEGAFGPRR